MTERPADTREDCDGRRSDDIAALLLGGLTQPEVTELEAHLESCPRCAERARWMQPAADLLPASVPQMAPSEELRKGLMTTVRAEAGPAPAAAPSPGIAARLGDWLDGFSLKPALAAAAAALLIAAGVAGYELGADDGAAIDARTVSVAPTTPRFEAAGSLEVRGDRGVIRLTSLPTLPGKQVYQAWVRTGERLEPSAVFVPDHTGGASAEVGAGLDGADELMITREPAGGSQIPHSAVIMSARLS